MSTGEAATLAVVHEVFADLLLEERELARWTDDPERYAAERLDAKSAEAAAARSMIAGIQPDDMEDAAHNMRHKEAEGRPQPGAQPRPVKADRAPRAPRELAPRPAERPAVGVGMRPPILSALFGQMQLVEVWEHTVDWYLDDGRAQTDALRAYAVTAPVALHSLGLSVGSFACLDDVERHDQIRQLIVAAGVSHISDHLAVSHVGARRLPHFVPLWRTEAQLDLVAANVTALQDRLGVRVVLENPAFIFDPGGEMSTAAFFNEVTARTGCGVLLDLENLRVNDANGWLDAAGELAELDLTTVIEVHVAGGTDAAEDEPAGDTHDQPVPEVVFDWLEDLLPVLVNCEHVILERDERFDEREEILEDVVVLHEVVTGGRPPGVRV